MFDQDKTYKIRWDVPIHVNGTWAQTVVATDLYPSRF